MQRSKYSLVFLLISSVLFLSSCQTQTTNGEDADGQYALAKLNFDNQNYPAAFQNVQAPANAGNPQAQYALGYMYYYGQGTPVDTTLGKMWIQKSALNGDADAQKALQSILSNEQKVVPNEVAPMPIPVAPATTPSVVATVAAQSVQPAATITPAPAPTPTRYTAAETALLLKNPAHYTLQLTSAASEASAKQYIVDNKITQAGSYFDHAVNGKHYYTVIYGDYPTRAAATTAAKSLAIKNASPWVRTFKSVQADIKG
jgi:septal ring-binding cell division protein DamX